MSIKNLFQLAVTGLAIVASKADVLDDQKNITQVEKLPVGLDGDPCNVGGSIYTDCQDKTKGLSYTQFLSCMEKIGDYSSRGGDMCCPDPDPTKDYYDCEPPKQDQRALYIAATVGPFATIISCIAAICCWKNRNKLKEFVTLNIFHEQKTINNDVTTPLVSDNGTVHSVRPL